LITHISRDEAEKIFAENSSYVFRTALYLTKSKELADDITQDTFIQAFRKYHTYDKTKPFGPWLYKIALNTTRNTLRRQKWLKFTEQIPELTSLDMVENSVLKCEEEKVLWNMLNTLSLKSREIIVLHFYLGLKLQEISDTLDIPLGTCKSRLNLALNKLRKQIPKNEFNILARGGDSYEII